MKVSELPHEDPAWGYVELDDGSLLPVTREALEEIRQLLDANARYRAELDGGEGKTGCPGSGEVERLRRENEALRLRITELEGRKSAQ